MRLVEFLQDNIAITDGAMGTYYSALYGEEEIAEWANLKYPERISKIHREYLEAGARILRTNTFAVNSAVMGVNFLEQQEIIRAGYRLAKQERDVYEAEQNKVCFIAADIGMIPVHGENSWEELKAEYNNIVDAFLLEGASVFWLETFSSFSPVKEICTYIKRKCPEAEIITNFCLNKNGYTAEGVSVHTLLNDIMSTEEISAGGFNCGIGSGHMYNLLANIKLPVKKPLVVLPNAGYPEQLQSRMVFRKNIDYFKENMGKIENLGVTILGGCCGTTPSYIKGLQSIQTDKNNKEKKVNSSIRVRALTGMTEEINTNKANTSNLKYADGTDKSKNSSFYDKLMRGEKVTAVELDPPFDAEDTKFLECANQVKQTNADVITIADSPMGRSRVDSILMSIKLMRECKVNVMPHVCCRDRNLIAMRSSLLGGYVNGIKDILVVTGDPVPSEQRMMTTGVFDYNSIRLMQFIKQMNEEHMTDRPICYGGALNPMLGNVDKIIERLKQKVDAGASYFLTQPVYAKEGMERLSYIKSKVDTKILGGIMPFVSYRNANFIKNEFIGIHVPDEVLNRYHKDMTKEEAEEVGAQLGSDLMNQLKDIVDGYYFMLPFNRVSLLKKIKDND